jgi:hypothetical protein
VGERVVGFVVGVNVSPGLVGVCVVGLAVGDVLGDDVGDAVGDVVGERVVGRVVARGPTCGCTHPLHTW